MRQSKINLTCRSRLNLRADSFLHQRLFVRRNEFTLHVPAVYLTWANPMFLAFFALSRISNLRAFNVSPSSILTAPQLPFC